MVQALEGDQALGDLRAVGDSDGDKSCILRPADGVAGAGNQRNVIGAYHTGIAWLLVEDAVAVEENGWALVADIEGGDFAGRNVSLGHRMAGGRSNVADIFRSIVGANADTGGEELRQQVPDHVASLRFGNVRKELR